MIKIDPLMLMDYVMTSFVYSIARAEYKITGANRAYGSDISENASLFWLKILEKERGLKPVLDSHPFDNISRLIHFFENLGVFSPSDYSIANEGDKLILFLKKCKFQRGCSLLLNEGNNQFACLQLGMFRLIAKQTGIRIFTSVQILPGDCRLIFELRD
ncbi:hypothetical protein JW964_12265 [candidate division KSB1 bacterium]|nr:hypothetical protein [candidate division KSB1 bacterium]